ncbi:MAG: hypothetical protein ACR2JF_07010 [Iamia sp.]
MDITLLSVPDCPNLRAARAQVDEALDRTGVEATVTEREVTSIAEADEMGMHGSPTVLVDGRAIPDHDGEPSVSCRLALPSVDQLVAALST